MKLFGIKTVDDALASLSEGLKDLEFLEDSLRDKAHAKTEQISVLQTERDDMLSEAERAKRVKGNLAAILA